LSGATDRPANPFCCFFFIGIRRITLFIQQV
jgi:hypothetical protein